MKVASLKFSKYFKGYNYPFLSADQNLSTKSPLMREQYYQNVYETMFDERGAMRGFMLEELEGMIRYFYSQLACKISNDVESAAYRVTLIFIRDLEKRFKFLASKHLQLKKLKQDYAKETTNR